MATDAIAGVSVDFDRWLKAYLADIEAMKAYGDFIKKEAEAFLTRKQGEVLDEKVKKARKLTIQMQRAFDDLVNETDAVKRLGSHFNDAASHITAIGMGEALGHDEASLFWSWVQTSLVTYCSESFLEGLEDAASYNVMWGAAENYLNKSKSGASSTDAPVEVDNVLELLYWLIGERYYVPIKTKDSFRPLRRAINGMKQDFLNQIQEKKRIVEEKTDRVFSFWDNVTFEKTIQPRAGAPADGAAADQKKEEAKKDAPKPR